MSEWKPWEDAPHIWRTEAEFWTWVRGGLRKALWSRYPVRTILKKNNTWNVTDKERKEWNLSGRVRRVGRCSLTGDIVPASQLEVDHISPAGSLRCEEDFLQFVKNLLCDKDNLRLVSKEAHKVHTYSEKMGISFEEALVEKQAIANTKLPIKKQKEMLSPFLDFLSGKGLRCNNAVERRAAFKLLIQENKL